jgi:hypothetical protein
MSNEQMKEVQPFMAKAEAIRTQTPQNTSLMGVSGRIMPSTKIVNGKMETTVIFDKDIDTGRGKLIAGKPYDFSQLEPIIAGGFMHFGENNFTFGDGSTTNNTKIVNQNGR